MHSYDYPKVRPPSSVAAIERHTSPRTMIPQDRHFSYTQTPVEARGQSFTSRDSHVPPLPPVPAHLATELLPTQTQTRVNDPLPAHTEYPPDIKENDYHNQPWRSAAEEETYPAEHEPQTTESPVLSQPVRVVVPSIGPDENPLTPSTPSRAAYKTTNMPALPPIGPSYSPFSAPSQPVTGGTWTHELCSCADPTTCMTSIFCPCIVYGKTQYRLNQRADKRDPTNMLGYKVVNGSCAAFAMLCGINGILAAIQHTRIRKTYSMGSEAGNVINDCLLGCCCCCCTIAQGEKEVRRREDAARGSDTPYQPPGGMLYAPSPR